MSDSVKSNINISKKYPEYNRDSNGNIHGDELETYSKYLKLCSKIYHISLCVSDQLIRIKTNIDYIAKEQCKFGNSNSIRDEEMRYRIMSASLEDIKQSVAKMHRAIDIK